MICRKEFAEHLVDGDASASGSEAAGSCEPRSSEPRPTVESEKYDVCTHFPKDRNCEVCRKTKITRALCRKHTHRVEKNDDLITADHKVLNEECESRNNHKYAVIVQDLATQWFLAYPCENKKLHRKRKSSSRKKPVQQ